MATTLHQVHQNFLHRISAISPTSNLCGKGFVPFDKSKAALSDSQGLERSYVVTWVEGGEDLEVTDQSYRDAMHTFQLIVAYWPGRGNERCHELVCQDQWDLVKTLRDDRLYIGTDDDSTVALNIISRSLTGQSLDVSDEDLWLLVQTWAVQLREVA